MTASGRAKVRLTLKAMTFVTCERDIGRGPSEQTMTVDAEVFDKMVSWAEYKGWRSPGRSLKCRYIPRHAVPVFVRHLRDAVAAEPAEQGRGSRARMDLDGPLRAFFAKPGNGRQLQKVLELLEGGGELLVEEAA